MVSTTEPPLKLSETQLNLVEQPLDTRIFLEGPAGCGKTTACVERLLYLLEHDVAGDSIIVIVPQRTLGTPYINALRTPGVTAGGRVSVLTMWGIARQMLLLFWPLIGEKAGFAHPEDQPSFLTMETSQYYLARLVGPLFDQGYFDAATIHRNRIYSQIIDNLNKSAVVGFSYKEIGERLKKAWIGEPAQARIYQDAQDCASRFREYCLENNLLDFSLQVEVFSKYLVNQELFKDYFQNRYQHILVDNIEEDSPVSHDLLKRWLPQFDSAVFVYDEDAGYRQFLGADVQSAYELRELCDGKIVFNESFVTSKEIQSLGCHLSRELMGGSTNKKSDLDSRKIQETEEPKVDPRPAFDFEYHRFFPEMLDWVAEKIESLISDEGIPPGEIVVLAPFVPDVIRFSLVTRLSKYEIPARSHRPSRPLREEPVTTCMLTLASIAHPEWETRPTRDEVVVTLMQAFEGMDLVRSRLLTDIVYRHNDGIPYFSSFDRINTEMQERITYRIGGHFQELSLWLDEYSQGPKVALDHFLSRLFGEVLSQPGFGFYGDYNAGEVVANLTESVGKFRRVVAGDLPEDSVLLGKEYIEMVAEGVIAAQYVRSWKEQQDDAVLISPAYTFLMRNRPADVQFWLSVGSRGWYERLYQPLTHPYILSRQWKQGKRWSEEDEYSAGQENLYRIAMGLIRRCGRKVFLGLSELGESGYEQRGMFLKAIHRIIQEFPSQH